MGEDDAEADIGATVERVTTARQYPPTETRRRSDGVRDVDTVKRFAQTYWSAHHRASCDLTVGQLVLSFLEATADLLEKGGTANLYTGRLEMGWTGGDKVDPPLVGVEDPFEAGDNKTRSVRCRQTRMMIIAMLRRFALIVRKAAEATSDEVSAAAVNDAMRALFQGEVGASPKLDGWLPPPPIVAAGCTGCAGYTTTTTTVGGSVTVPAAAGCAGYTTTTIGGSVTVVPAEEVQKALGMFLERIQTSTWLGKQPGALDMLQKAFQLPHFAQRLMHVMDPVKYPDLGFGFDQSRRVDWDSVDKGVYLWIFSLPVNGAVTFLLEEKLTKESGPAARHLLEQIRDARRRRMRRFFLLYSGHTWKEIMERFLEHCGGDRVRPRCVCVMCVCVYSVYYKKIMNTSQ